MQKLASHVSRNSQNFNLDPYKGAFNNCVMSKTTNLDPLPSCYTLLPPIKNYVAHQLSVYPLPSPIQIPIYTSLINFFGYKWMERL